MAVLALAFLCGVALVAAFRLAPVDRWKLIWSDEFSGPAGAGVKPADWIYDTGTGYGCAGCPRGWGTGEIETMSDSAENVALDGAGHLLITPIRTGDAWTSGRIETRRTDFGAPVGGVVAFEAAIQLPDLPGVSAKGYWPAFWALGAPFRGNYLNWPAIGEIDIMENVNGRNSWVGTLHCGVSPGGPCDETNGLTSGEIRGFTPTLQSAFHVYRAELDRSTSPEEIRWYVDGVRLLTVRAPEGESATWARATDHGFFIILNVAIGGGWPGSPTDDTESGAPMRVDYVRGYAR